MMLARMNWWLTAAVAVAACGGPQRPAADTTGPAAAESAAAAPDTTAVDTAAGPARPAFVEAATGPNAFRHEKHRELECRRCHAAVPGHSMHANIACTSCHAPVPVTGPVPKSEQCAACHHATTQTYACTACHDSTSHGALDLTVTWQLSVWPAPRQREVHFDHAWHTSQACTNCHTNRPAMVPTRECGSCHEHHDGKADCRICHRSPPPGVHTVAAHAGCAGSGCHQSPPVRVATLSRNECLLCHADRVNHEPGRMCAECHMLQPGGASGAGKEPEPR
ncbi:MAG TPA: hypothetical protein VF737_10940 [Gemmatimonadaceae bacterium]